MMVDYSKMSDFEINKRVALSLGFTLYKEGKSCQVNHVAIEEGSCGAFTMDWCNNPADAWPIIVENRISINFDSSPDGDAPVEWVTANTEYFSGYLQVNKALRAAMIVFLMMRDAKNG